MLLINLQTPVAHANFEEVEQLCRQEGLGLGPTMGSYPRNSLNLQFNRLKAHTPRITIEQFIKLTQSNSPQG